MTAVGGLYLTIPIRGVQNDVPQVCVDGQAKQPGGVNALCGNVQDVYKRQV